MPDPARALVGTSRPVSKPVESLVNPLIWLKNKQITADPLGARLIRKDENQTDDLLSE